MLVASVPRSLRDAFARGGFYVFSREFLEDIPKRLTGPGRLRFVFQPLLATALGIRAGRADRRAERPPGFQSIVNLLLMGILLDSLFQWILLGASYPGAALVVGPVLIAVPYACARALANRIARLAPVEERK